MLRPAAEQPSITWIGRDKDGEKITFVFKADNTFLWTDAKGDSVSAKYELNFSTKPIQLDMFDFTPRFPEQKEDVRMRCILEFEGESRLRFNADSKGERPKEIYKDTTFFTKVQ